MIGGGGGEGGKGLARRSETSSSDQGFARAWAAIRKLLIVKNFGFFPRESQVFRSQCLACACVELPLATSRLEKFRIMYIRVYKTVFVFGFVYREGTHEGIDVCAIVCSNSCLRS